MPEVQKGVHFLLAVLVFAGGTTSLQASDPDSLVDRAWLVVYQSYYDASFNGIDWLSQRSQPVAPGPAPVDAHAVVESMLEQLGDPAVRFLEEAELDALLGDLTGWGGSGIGLMELLSVDIDEETGRLTVVTPVPGSPAARAGLRPGDVISAIDGRPTSGLPLHEAAALLRTEAGAEILLTIERDGGTTQERVKCEDPPSQLPNIETALDNESGVGYIRLGQFVGGSAQAVRDSMQKVIDSSAGALILDLRNNPGGFVPEMLGIADLFLAQDLSVGVLMARGDTLQDLRTSESAFTDLPLAVLVNGGSASAAEVLAGALQAHDRAVIVGSRTFGKGLAHNFETMSDGSAVMLPIARVVTPHGRDVLTDAIEPDIVVESEESPILDEGVDVRGPDDRVYRAARANLPLTSFPFDLNLNHPYIEVRVNGSGPLWFLLDTGAQVTMIDRDVADRLGLPTTPVRAAAAGGGSSVVELSALSGLTLDVGGLSDRYEVAYAMPINDLMARHEGREVHGLLGFDFMNRYVVEIDHTAMRIRLFDPAGYRHVGDGVAVPMVLVNNHPHVDAALTFEGEHGPASVSGTFILDTGATGPVYLSTSFVNTNGLLDLGLRTRTAFVAGIGGLSEQQVGRAQMLRFGEVNVHGPTVYLSQDESGGFAGQLGADGIIGTEILRRYEMTLDYQGTRVILDENRHAGEPFTHAIADLTGFYLMRREGGSRGVWVEETVPGGPADAAGIRPADLILAIDGKSTSEISMESIRRLFMREAPLVLRIDRQGEVVEVELHPRESL